MTSSISNGLVALYGSDERIINNNNNKRGHVYFQHDGAPPHFSCEVRNFLNCRFPGKWIGHGGLHNWPARCPEFKPTGLLCMGMDERTG